MIPCLIRGFRAIRGKEPLTHKGLLGIESGVFDSLSSFQFLPRKAPLARTRLYATPVLDIASVSTLLPFLIQNSSILDSF
jgi:hypothetical protein